MNTASCSEEQDAALRKFYEPVGSSTTEQKIALLERELGGRPNISPSTAATPETILGVMEYEYLLKEGLFIPALA